MKVELTRAEIERIILAHLNGLIPGQDFNTVEPTGYRSMPDGFVVSTKEEKDAAQ
jgi:hypothetical protein